MASILRFLNNCNAQQHTSTGPLTLEELSSSLKRLIQFEQHKFLKNDLQSLQADPLVRNKSKLVSLKPCLKSDGLICVGGRIHNSQMTYQHKHPIVLPSESHLTQLIITNEHIRQMHAGPLALLAAIRRQYWPLNARNLTRRTVQKCIRCFKA